MSNPYLIKDLARLSGFSIYTIKYYLKIGLIKESGRSPETNFRFFDDTTLKQLETIRQLRREKKSIRQIKEILSEGV
ncbi:MAG: MerR family transcriptional regulator [Candidatus Omnitrophica bacterium]|nr:MerR family transcriptional regulator [Candidatus Omnitrophota bacterium]MDD5351792.1 MerR family transcriptional regulator [Candidatus Omnitrophota bacterium]MDD5550618.1 MerR family transcriptional regulator [Candidatus Omnitrophota bacterium]